MYLKIYMSIIISIYIYKQKNVFLRQNIEFYNFPTLFNDVTGSWVT